MVISSRKFENFEIFCPLGAMKLGVQQKKLLHLASISPYISKVHGHFWFKFGMVPFIYRSLMLLHFCVNLGRGWVLQLNFLGFQIEENF